MKEVFVVGSAQDGGVPHAGCEEFCCLEAWANPTLHRYPSSIAAVCKETKSFWLFDATPDIKHQIHLLKCYDAYLSGIFLTHAHIGHFAGLTSLGLEIMNLMNIPVYVMPYMKKFLLESPFLASLIESNVIKIKSIEECKIIDVGPFGIEAFNVPHRNELSETVGFRVSGDSKSIIYLPDIDSWEGWEGKLLTLVSENDYLLIDGTYYDKNEIKSRNIDKIPHPEIRHSLEILSSLDKKERKKIYFTHFNHTNTVIQLNSQSGRRVIDEGYNLLKEKKVFKI